MNILRNINPENDKKLDKMLDAKFSKRRSIVKGSTIRTAQSLMKRVIKSRKQFEDNSFNKPVGEKVSKHNAHAYKVTKKKKVTKHGDHDQRSHSPTGRSQMRQEGKTKKPSKAPAPKGATDKLRLKLSTNDLIASYGKGKNKPMTPGNPDGYLITRGGQKRHPGKAERSALVLGLKTPGAKTMWAREVKRGIKRKLKNDKVAKVAKHGKHDQRTHSPTGRAAIASEKKPSKKPSGASSKAPAKVRVRTAIQGAKDTVQRTREAVSRNKENFKRVGREIDSVLDGLDSASRLYRELMEAKNLITDRLEDKKKVTKGKVTHTEAYNRVKGKPGVKDPHALAQRIVEDAGGEKTKKALSIDEARERHARLREEKVNKSIEKGISHSLEILNNALKLISAQEADAELSEADEKKLQEIIDEILGVAGYLETVKEQGHFEKGGGDASVPDSTSTFRPSFTTPAVAEHLRREGTKPNAKGRGTTTAREPGY